jgi:hypothetical protein
MPIFQPVPRCVVVVIFSVIHITKGWTGVLECVGMVGGVDRMVPFGYVELCVVFILGVLVDITDFRTIISQLLL